jgi:hypothetical protein
MLPLPVIPPTSHSRRRIYRAGTNSIATALTLHSDTVNYAAIKNPIASQTNDLITVIKTQEFPYIRILQQQV